MHHTAAPARAARPAPRLVAITLSEAELVELGRAAALAQALFDAVAADEGGKTLRRLAHGLAEALTAVHRGIEPDLYRCRPGGQP